MGSQIDLDFPSDGVPVAKAGLRANFRQVRAELEHGGFVRLAAAGALDRTAGERLAERISVRDFGALGDSSGAPVAEWLSGGRHDRGYPDLAAIRADFPHVASTADTIDWAATQAAIDAVAGVGGGWVNAPGGRYVCNRPLLFPPAATFTDEGAAVSLAGDGARVTVFHWPVDLGAGAFALGCADREVENEGVWQDFGLLGNSDHAAVPLGTPPYQMSGFGIASRRRILRCRASGFFAGLDLVGDHGHVTDCLFNGNHYGMYIARPARFLWGDWLFTKTAFNGAKLAAIAIHPETQLGAATFVSCYIGGAPYAILKEAGGSDQILSHSLFLNTLFEYIGNALIAELDRPKRGRVYRCRFDLPGFSWDDRYRLPSAPRSALIDVHRLERVTIDKPKEPFFWRPGDEAMLRIDAGLRLTVSDGVEELLDHCEASGIPWLHEDALASQGYASYLLLEPGSWRGRPAPCIEPVRRGQLLAWQGDQVVPAGADTGAIIAGVCMLSAEPGAFTVVATEGAALEVAAAPGVRTGDPVAVGADGRIRRPRGRWRAQRLGRVRHVDGESARIELLGGGG